MAPQTGTALLLIAAFVLPGFVTVLLRERTYHVRAGTDAFELLLTALYYSALINLTAAVAAVCAGVFTGLGTGEVSALYRGESTLAVYAGLAFVGVGLGPLVIALAGKRWADSGWRRAVQRKLKLDPTHATRSGWEHFFSQRRECLVRVTLDDGRLVGGFFGENSMAGYTRDGQDIFLEERWVLDEDGWFAGSPSDQTIGVYVPGAKIVSLEVYDYPRAAADSGA
jgi:hypothetical protein